MNIQQIEELTQEKGLEIFNQIKDNSRTKNSSIKTWWYKQVLSWTMKNDSFKTNMFHFIDVLPSLKTAEQILVHLNEYFKNQDIKILTSGLGNLAPQLMAKTIKKQVHEMAKIFITGSTIEEGLKNVPKIHEQNFLVSFDLLGEATLSYKEAHIYQKQYLKLMDELIKEQANWKLKPTEDQWGPIPLINISIKATSLYPNIKEEAWEFTKEEIKNQLRPLFKKAVENFIFINLDMESYQYKNLFNELFKELLLESDFKDYPHFGIVIQAYLQDSFTDLQDFIQFTKKRKQPLTIRLVKGAYWDSEVLIAKQKNWPVPVYTEKTHTDANFENCLNLLFENNKYLKIAVGSHNIRSISKALALHQIYPQASLEFQVLYGMGESIAQTLVKQGYPVRLYSTIGEFIPGMSYLVRRLLENTANQSFIKSLQSQNYSEKDLLKKPTDFVSKNKLDSKLKFENHPILDFSIKNNRDQFQKNLKKWKFPLTVPIVLNGKEETSSEIRNRKNPSHIDQIISYTHLANKEQAERAVQNAQQFFEEWKQTDPQKRISYLRKLAQLIKEKEFEFSALQVFEVGKTWQEAHADVCESIDFCNYYADRFSELSQSQKTCEISGEESLFVYEAIGPTAVISPWNFPLAILTGMIVAPLVCGNTVIIKPAEQSSLTAYELVKLLLKAGFPKESFSFLPGKGEDVGAHLVKHPDIPIISFTGSFEVGSQIIQETKTISKNQKHFKKSIIEMGGKNAIVVDLSADLDEAIAGILFSAFSFQGQKCSAASRVIVLEDVFDQFIDRLIPATDSLIMGSSKNPHVFLGPIVDQDARDKISYFLNEKTSQAKQLYKGKTLDGGWFISPTIFITDQADSPLMQEELFAPILTLFKVKTLKEAIEQVNNTRYGLTASFYSRHPSHIEQFKKFAEVGNVYINRNCTGALVERHPFGGYKMSGLGSKTGGLDYLKHFLHTKITTENTMRRGFAPEIFSEEFLNKI